MTVLVNDILPLLGSHNEKTLGPNTNTFLVTVDQRRSIPLLWPSGVAPRGM